MPRNKGPVIELGSIYVHRGEFRAHIHFRDDDGKQENIYGPSRATEGEAQKDLTLQVGSEPPTQSRAAFRLKGKIFWSLVFNVMFFALELPT